MKSNRLLIAVVVAMLSSPGVVAGQQLFGMSPVPLAGETPVAIDPTSGTVTGLTPGTSFTGNAFDVGSSANTLYFVSSTNPTLLNSVNETTGVLNFTFLSAPVTDMTVDPASGKLFGMSPVFGGATPVAIDPTSGTVTGLTPGTTFTGSAFDVVSSASTLYFVSSTNLTLLNLVNETTGVLNFTFLSAPVTDMTVGVTGASTVPIPGALPLFATGLGALGLLGWRRKKKAQANAA